MRWPSSILPRVHPLNQRHHAEDRAYVLVWLRQTLRGWCNPVVDAAILFGNEHRLPVVIYHGLDDRYPYASDRIHTFALQASLSMEAAFARRNVRYLRYVRRPGNYRSGLVTELAKSAAAVFIDLCSNDWLSEISASLSRQVDAPCWSVDAARLVPGAMFEKKIVTTKAFRSKHTRLRKSFLQADPADGPATEDVEATTPRYEGPVGDLDAGLFEPEMGTNALAIREVVGQCRIDHSLPPVVHFPGDRESALQRLGNAVENVIAKYKWTRNNASLPNSTSGLSPYLHFGVLSPIEVARAVDESDLHSAAKWKFLDELLTWREHYHHLADHSSSYASYSNLPRGARMTLDEHREDSRAEVYSLSDLMHARTNDATWNAAQLQFLCDGWMHNNLRMYWAKQIIRFRPSPEDAWATACYLNDRLSLDGRDVSTYGGIQWAFGNAKPAYRESPIYGWVSTKSDAAIRKRPGMSDWIASQCERPRPTISCPQEAPLERYTRDTAINPPLG